jgi:hypothetical protein
MLAVQNEAARLDNLGPKEFEAITENVIEEYSFIIK